MQHASLCRVQKYKTFQDYRQNSAMTRTMLISIKPICTVQDFTISHYTEVTCFRLHHRYTEASILAGKANGRALRDRRDRGPIKKTGKNEKMREYQPASQVWGHWGRQVSLSGSLYCFEHSRLFQECHFSSARAALVHKHVH